MSWAHWAQKAKRLKEDAATLKERADDPDLPLEQRNALLVEWGNLLEKAEAEQKAARLISIVDRLQFHGRRKLTKETNDRRFAFLQRIFHETGKRGRKDLTHAAWNDAEAKEVFPSEDSIYKMLKPEMFNRIRKRSK